MPHRVTAEAPSVCGVSGGHAIVVTRCVTHQQRGLAIASARAVANQTDLRLAAALDKHDFPPRPKRLATCCSSNLIPGTPAPAIASWQTSNRRVHRASEWLTARRRTPIPRIPQSLSPAAVTPPGGDRASRVRPTASGTRHPTSGSSALPRAAPPMPAARSPAPNGHARCCPSASLSRESLRRGLWTGRPQIFAECLRGAHQLRGCMRYSGS